MENFVALLLASRDMAHKFHWASKKYSEHKILGKFYDELLELTDSLVEAYQGKMGLLKTIPKINTEMKTTALDTLQGHMDWIEKQRYVVCKKEDAALQSLVDSIVVLYLQTIYKLTNLE